MRKLDDGFLDIISLISFCIGLQNLGLNINQDDLQKESERLDKALRDNVEEIHMHLKEQDRMLKELLNDKNQRVGR